MNSYRNIKWLRSRRGIIFGVCQGFADWKDMSAGMIRFVLIMLFLFTGGGLILLIYLGLAVFLPAEPRDPDQDDRGGKGFPPWDDPGDFRRWRERD